MNKVLIIIALLLLVTTISAQEDGDDISIGKYRIIKSEVLNEDRRILVHLPDGYENSTQDYAVMYLMQGEFVSLYFAEAVHVVDVLSGSGIIPPMIIVGIGNTEHRYRDEFLVQRDGSPAGINKFSMFFKNELIPYINNNYRTKNFRVLAGPQHGAFFGLYSLYKNPELFNAAILENPFRWKNNNDPLFSIIDSVLNTDMKMKNFLHITYVKEEPECFEFVEYYSELVKKQDPQGFHYIPELVSNNGEFYNPTGLKSGIKRLFESYQLPESYPINNFNDLQHYYDSLNNSLGSDFEIPEMTLIMQADQLIDENKFSEAIVMMEYVQKNNPSNLNSYTRLGRIYTLKEDYQQAIKYYNMFLERRPEVDFIRKKVEKLEANIQSKQE